MNKLLTIKIQLFFVILFLIPNVKIFAQNITSDTSKLPYPIRYSNNPLLNQQYNSPLYLQPPSVFEQDVKYDPVTGNFIIEERVGNIKISRPYILSFEDYNSIKTNNFISNLRRQNLKSEYNDGDFLDNFLNSQINFGIKGLGKVFGSDNISIQPNGNIDISLGILHHNIDNKILPKRQRRQTNFEYTQDIQLGINGKVGTKMSVAINYNSKSMFKFENRKKVEYTGEEDEIIQKIEAGDISFPAENSLIQGSTTLFGFRTDLKFGRLTVTSVFSQQQGESKTIEIQGGDVMSDFDISASDYQANRHFFLSHFFRDHYEEAMANLPLVTSQVKITRVEVWVTNTTSDFENARNVVGFMDLAEAQKNIHAQSFISQNPGKTLPDNELNNLYQNITTNYSSIRNISNASNVLSSIPNFVEGIDFIKLESARKLKPNDYYINTDLGFISLNSELRQGEIIAVAFEYTVNGKVFKVGEFSNDIDAPQSLILKILRGPAAIPNLPTWDLMMKNIYSLNTYSLSKEDFQMEIIYNNDKTGTPINYIPEGKIAKKRLLSVMKLDNADLQNNPNPDGFFDFIEGITVNTQKALIILPELEPFGSYLEKEIDNKKISDQYVYHELYDSTQYIAQQLAYKNKFYLRGKYKSSGGNEIMLNVMNVPQGSVKVTQGGQTLAENIDYTVDYNIGRVTIINQAKLNSGTPIKISLESNDEFGMTKKTLSAAHFNYQFNKNFNVGATVMHMSELPVNTKTRFGSEPISNTIYGFNTNYSVEVPFFTKMVDFLPFIETKAPSNLNISAEFAQLVPGNPKVLGKSGTSFLDDFEDSQTYIDLKAPNAWVLSSIPQGQPHLFPEASDGVTTISGYNRAKIAWYEVNEDLVNMRSTTRPGYITLDDISNHMVRLIYEKEIFPNKQNYNNNAPTRISVLNVSFYPKEKGPYNFDVEGSTGISAGINETGELNSPETRWAGIMRDLYITDFESANIGFIEFWLLDPFVYDSLSVGGDLYFNLGDVSEDILKDSRKSMENGIPYPFDASKIDSTQWGIVSKAQMTTQNFDNDPNVRAVQDAGYDGLLDDAEAQFHQKYLLRISQKYGINSKAYINAAADPSNDNFIYFLAGAYSDINADILERYKSFNGTEGNSPVNTGNNNYSAVTQYPDMEDVNKDNTLDPYEAYYQYRIHLAPGEMNVGDNYIVNKVTAKAINLPNKDKDQTITWYQFKIPIKNPDKIVGNVQGFKSIRFFRMFLNNFKSPVTLRFARMNLIKEQWRQYDNTITQGGEVTPSPEIEGNGTLDVSVVNIEESTQKEPVNYVLPPGVQREQDIFDHQTHKLNEQSMSLKIIDLPDGEAKGVYKNLNLDLRKFKRLQMYIHEEALIGEEEKLEDNDLTLFVRLGSDFTHNYYEYEIPLKKTPASMYNSNDNDPNAADRYIVWPTENELDLSFETLLDAKQSRNIKINNSNTGMSLNTPYETYDGNNKITIIGNPNLANVKSIMVGIRNPKQQSNVQKTDDGQPKSAEIWVNELRLTDFNSSGGWAANARISANFADFANISLNAYTHTPGFGSVEKRVNERYKDQTFEYDLTSQVQFGKFFSKDYGVSIPMYLGFSRSVSNPEYNPFDPDIKFNTALAALNDEDKTSLKNAAQTFTQRRSINFTNINIQGKSKSRTSSSRSRSSTVRNKINPPWKISNFSLSVAYNETFSRTPVIKFHTQQNLMYGINYNYSPNSKAVRPFRKVKFLNKKAFQLIKDFNFYYLPTRINFSTEVNRQYITFQNRDISSSNIELPTSYQKNFMWRRNYDISYKLSQSLKIDFNASNSARIEPDGWRAKETFFKKIGLKQLSDTVFLHIYDLGYNTDYNQQIRVNYQVPINKLPLLRWTSLTANYTVKYDWRKGEDPYTVVATDTTPEYTVDFANTIQNSSTLNLNGRLNFLSLYNNIKYLKGVNSRFTKNGRKPAKQEEKEVTFTKKTKLFKGTPVYILHNMKTTKITKFQLTTSDGQPLKSDNYEVVGPNKIKYTPDTTMKDVKLEIVGKRTMPENAFIVISDYTLKTIMMLKSVSINYKVSGGTLVNGFKPFAKVFGTERNNNKMSPGWEFIVGLQDRMIVDKYADYNWITEDTLFNLPMNFTNSKEYRVRLNLEPINNLRIDVNFQRNITTNESVYGHAVNNEFIEQTKMTNGNFFISFNTIISSFENVKKSPNFESKYYQDFLDRRSEVAYGLANERAGKDPNYQVVSYTDTLGNTYPVGYSQTSQNVLISSFLSAYSGISTKQIGYNPLITMPLPDWRVTFDGLSNLPFIKDYVTKITLTHSYASTYSVNNFNTNANFNFDLFDEIGVSNALYETNQMFIPRYEISGIMISEKFVPFFGIDVVWKGPLSTRFDYKRSRDLFLSFSNNQIRERHNNSFTIGAGYTFKDLKMNLNIGGKARKLNSDLNLRLDFTKGHDIEIYRRIVENLSQENTERDDFTLTFTADYSINNKLSIQYFYNHSIMETNTAPKTTNVRTGIKIRYTLTP